MVKNWLRNGILLSVLLMSCMVSANNSRMVPNQLMLGQAVTWVLEGNQVAKHFEQSDLSELKRHFYIERVIGRDDRLRVKLYPYRVEQIRLDPIQLGDSVFTPPVIEVTENPDIEVVWQPPAEQDFYQNQVIYWRAKLLADSANFSVSIDTEAESDRAFLWLGTAHKDRSQGAFGHQWHVTAAAQLIRPGNYLIDSPKLWVRNPTQQQWLFVAPPKPMTVKPLPSFVPRDVPVGQLTLLTTLPMRLIEKGTLYHWRYQWLGQDLELDNFRGFADSLNPENGVEWLSPSKQTITEMQLDGLHSKLIVEQPFRVDQYGWINLPPLNVTYFDVASGKLVNQRMETPWLIVVPTWMIWLLKLLGWGLVLIGLFGIGQLTRSMYLKWRLIRQLQMAADPQTLWAEIQHWSKFSQAWAIFKGHPINQQGQSSASWNSANCSSGINLSGSLGAWLNWYEKRYGDSNQARELVSALNHSFYGNSHYNPKQAALDWAQQLPNLDFSLFKICIQERLHPQKR